MLLNRHLLLDGIILYALCPFAYKTSIGHRVLSPMSTVLLSGRLLATLAYSKLSKKTLRTAISFWRHLNILIWTYWSICIPLFAPLEGFAIPSKYWLKCWSWSLNTVSVFKSMWLQTSESALKSVYHPELKVLKDQQQQKYFM